MSSKIIIHTDVVKQSISELDKGVARLLDAQREAAGVRHGLDPRVLRRNAISSRLNAVSASIGEVENKVNQLKSFVSSSVSQYKAVESRLNQSADALEEELTKLVNNHTASNTYELYNNTVGRLQDFLHAMQYSAGAGVLHLLGFTFPKVDNLLYRFELADEVMIGKAKIPVGKAIRGIENSKLNFLARVLAKPKTLLGFYKDKSLADLVYKRFTHLFPKDLVNLSNNMALFKKDLSRSATSIKSTLNAVKTHAGSIVKSSLKVGKANALAAFVITAGTEAVGAGIKITENYSIYRGNVEKLKEENAKVVGRAVYKTGVVTATSVGGAVIGGAIGSIAGPIGTVAGASIGGFIGSWAGDKICDKTPAFVDKAALHFKNGIYKGTEAIASGVEKVKDGYHAVKDGYNAVKDHAANLLNSSKKFLGGLSFGH
ncbi:hypothetical protein [Neobacillus dielmonensis]|uniref:hypothetical protein n=1 Tax=Neobacillus dielmonensis TaxID=1347369 RepID=UPI00069367C1|nr:hypothetical protein [Neobacillus dielmonensis]